MLYVNSFFLCCLFFYQSIALINGEYSQSLTISNHGPVKRERRGVPKKFGRVIGGRGAIPNEFPFHLALSMDDEVSCGASLLSEYWAITAAHCTEPYEAQYLKLIAGDHTRSKNDGNEQERQVVEVINHPNYTATLRGYYNDISLLKVEKPFVLNNYVQPIKLAGQRFVVTRDVFAIGWGVVNVTTKELADTLQKVDVPVVDDATCRAAFANQEVKIKDHHICAGYLKKGGKDACQGDSGGSLIKKVYQDTLLIGVSSFGASCALPEYPGVYTETRHFHDWINSHVFPPKYARGGYKNG